MKKLQDIFEKIKKFSKNRKIVLISLMLAAVLGFLGWRVLGSKQEKAQYQTARAEKGTLIVSISTSGQVSSANNTSVTTQASGVVAKVYAQNGQLVKVGDKIAELELDLDGKLRSTQAWASYQGAKNNLESAKSTLYTLDSSMWAANRIFVNDALARGLLVYDPTYIQESDNWLAAEAKYINQSNVVNQSQTSVNSAWLSYQQVSPIIYAPISGTVTGLSLQKGIVLVAQSTTSGSASSQKIASIKTDAPAQLSVDLTEVDVTKIEIGDKATITLDAFPDKTYTGKVISVDTIGSVSSGVTSYPAVIGLDAEAPEILPNMSVNAKIITSITNDVILVPSAVIQTTEGESTVKVLKDGQVSSVVVEIGEANDTQTAAISGLNEGDIVITGIVTSTNSKATNSSTTSSPFSSFGGGAVRGVNIGPR